MTAFWFLLASGFNGWVAYDLGATKALEFATGYLVELSLSVDNLFVFLVVFAYFGVKPEFQHRVLYYGILGALLMRALFIFALGELVQRFEMVLLFFGAFLIYTGFKILFLKEDEIRPERNLLLRLARRTFRMTPDLHGEKFFVRIGGLRYATPLFLVLLVIESTDLAFAVDSIPAIYGITKDPFIVYTSNIFAILGLRSLYFLLATAVGRFPYLGTGLGLVLMFIGAKMTTTETIRLFWGLDIHYPTLLSLAVVGFLLGTFVLLSLVRRPPRQEAVPTGSPRERTR